MSENDLPEAVKQTAVKDIQTGGDVIVGDITQIAQQTLIQQQKTDFFELSLKQYRPSNFPSPKISKSLVEKLKQQRLLVFGGSSEVDKDSLARHIASCLVEDISSGNQKVIAEEWSRSSGLQGIDVKLQNTEISTILVLTRVSPQDIGYDLARVRKAAIAANHYVVLSTSVPFADWKLLDSTKVLWRELAREDVADSERLINELSREENLNSWYHEKRERPREQLIALGLSFFSGLLDDQFFAALEEVVERTWKRRDESLRSLDYCDLDSLSDFFNFTETKTQGTQIEVRSPKQRQILFKVAWNSHRRQILSALPVLVNMVRASVSENPSNQELYNTEEKCKQIRKVVSETISDIGSISEIAIQPILLQLAADENVLVKSTAAYAMARWRDPDYDLDKQLFNTLHNWVDLIQSQYLIDQVDAFLKGKQTNNKTSTAQDYIKVTVALTVSYAALYDPPIEVPSSKGLSEELFDLIKKLSTDTSFLVRQTFFDETLPRVLYLHLVQLSEWLLDVVKQQVSVSGLEPESIRLSNLGVGKSLAFAYARLPGRIVTLLDTWTEEANKIASSDIDISEITARESLLATIAWAYGAVEFSQSEPFLSPTQIFERLYNLLKIEEHPFVREAILEAIIYQAARNLRDIESQLRSLVAHIEDSECENLIKALGLTYLQQRIQLSGGEYWSPIKKIRNYSYRYQIWLRSQRPQTEIEAVMYDWLESESESTQKVAMRSLVYFVELFDEDEENEKQRILDKLDKEKEKIREKERQKVLNKLNKLDESNSPEKGESSEYGPFFIISWLTIILKWFQYVIFGSQFHDSFVQEWVYYRRVVSRLLPELLKHNSFSKFGVGSNLKRDLEQKKSIVKRNLRRKTVPLTRTDLTLNKLTSLSDRKIKNIADLLRFGVWIYKKIGFLVVGIILVTLLLWNPLFLLIGFGISLVLLVMLSRKLRVGFKRLLRKLRLPFFR